MTLRLLLAFLIGLSMACLYTAAPSAFAYVSQRTHTRAAHAPKAEKEEKAKPASAPAPKAAKAVKKLHRRKAVSAPAGA